MQRTPRKRRVLTGTDKRDTKERATQLRVSSSGCGCWECCEKCPRTARGHGKSPADEVTRWMPRKGAKVISRMELFPHFTPHEELLEGTAVRQSLCQCLITWVEISHTTGTSPGGLAAPTCVKVRLGSPLLCSAQRVMVEGCPITPGTL